MLINGVSRIFDLPDGGARLLRIREGHAAPPLFINCEYTYIIRKMTAVYRFYVPFFKKILNFLGKRFCRDLFFIKVLSLNYSLQI